MNQTFSQGEFPDCLKTAKVIPLFKSGSKTDVDNYRSITLLPVLSKVLAKIMYNRLIKFLDKNDILFEKQSGLRSEHSTVDALVSSHKSGRLKKIDQIFRPIKLAAVAIFERLE